MIYSKVFELFPRLQVLNGEAIYRNNTQENQQANQYCSNDARENGDGSSESELSQDWNRNSEIISAEDAVRNSNPTWSLSKH